MIPKIDNLNPGPDGLSMIVPAYNEAEGIQHVLTALTSSLKEIDNKEIIVIDDGSNDGTAEKVESFTGVRLVRHAFNQGYGASIKTGIAVAAFNTIGIIDADGTYPADQIPSLLEMLQQENADMAVGARTGADVHIPLIRRPAKWFLLNLANYLTGKKIPDINSGLRVIKKELLQRYIRILPDGFSLTTTITLALMTNGWTVAFKPIDYHVREGISKIRPIPDTIDFFILILRIMTYFQPLKIFVPACLSCLLISFVLLFYHTFNGGSFGITIVIFFVSGINLLAIGLLADLINRRLQ